MTTSVRISPNLMAAALIALLLAGCTDAPLSPDHKARHFTGYKETSLSHLLRIDGATYDQGPVPSGWEIGVFTPGGVCSGSMIWHDDGQPHVFVAYGADVDAPNQFWKDDELAFRFWNNITNEEITSVVAHFVDGSPTWISEGQTTLSLSGQRLYTCSVRLNKGWNLISVNVIPPQPFWVNQNGPDVRKMMSQFRVGDSMLVELMKDETGNVYAPALGDFCNIPYWNLGEGYQVKMENYAIGKWTGEPIPPGADVPIASGWNIIAYYPTYQLAASVGSHYYVITPILDNVVIVRNDAGEFMVPRIPFSNMDPWHEGAGYQINVNADVVLNYPGAREAFPPVPIRDTIPATIGPWTAHQITGVNMSVLISEIAGIIMQSQDAIAAFSSSGNLVGFGQPTEGKIGLAVWGNDATTDLPDGLQQGEAFHLKYWSAASDSVFEIRASVTYGSGLIYKTDDLVVCTGTIQR